MEWNGMEWNRIKIVYIRPRIYYTDTRLFLCFGEYSYTVLEDTDFIAHIVINASIDDSIYRVGRKIGLSFDFYF